MRILFCGGGTGGHVSPALAIAEAAVTKREIREIAFVGRVGGAQNKAITDKKYKLYEIEISGLLRKFSFENLKRFRRRSNSHKKYSRISSRMRLSAREDTSLGRLSKRRKK